MSKNYIDNTKDIAKLTLVPLSLLTVYNCTEYISPLTGFIQKKFLVLMGLNESTMYKSLFSAPIVLSVLLASQMLYSNSKNLSNDEHQVFSKSVHGLMNYTFAATVMAWGYELFNYQNQSQAVSRPLEYVLGICIIGIGGVAAKLFDTYFYDEYMETKVSTVSKALAKIYEDLRRNITIVER